MFAVLFLSFAVFALARPPVVSFVQMGDLSDKRPLTFLSIDKYDALNNLLHVTVDVLHPELLAETFYTATFVKVNGTFNHANLQGHTCTGSQFFERCPVVAGPQSARIQTWTFGVNALLSFRCIPDFANPNSTDLFGADVSFVF